LITTAQPKRPVEQEVGDDVGNSDPSVSSNPCCSELDRAGGGFGRALWLVEGPTLGGWTELFLVTIVLTSVTGFPLPPFGLDPPRMVGILSLILLAVALLAIYVFRVSYHFYIRVS
jgi:hypothetical protein